MSCNKCDLVKTLFCGYCGSKKECIIICRQCSKINDAEKSHCTKCKEMITPNSFRYLKAVTTREDMLRDVLAASPKYNDKYIDQFAKNMKLCNDVKCSECGGNNEIVGISQYNMLKFPGKLGVFAVDLLLGYLSGSNDDYNDDDDDNDNDDDDDDDDYYDDDDDEVASITETLEEHYVRACLICGNVWFTL